MKRINKNIIVSLMAFTCMSLFSGCSSKAKIVGDEAAKMLLVNERLDSEGLSNSNFNFNVSKNVRKKQAHRDIKKVSKVRDVNFNNGPKMSKTGTNSTKDGNTIKWSTFEEYSNGISYFDSFIKNINQQVKMGGNLIDQSKRKVDSNNVWVDGLMYESLVQVNAEEDLVMRRNNNGYQIVSRTINEQGVESFDIFTSQIGDKYGSRVRKLGDYRYEYSYKTEENDFEHYFVADKSRGYWVVLSPGNNTQFSTTIIKENRIYDLTINVQTGELLSLKVITPDQKCDIVRIHYDTFSFYAGGLTNIDYLTMDVKDSEIANLSDYDYQDENISVLYDPNSKEYSTNGSKSPSVHLKNGKIINPNDKFVNGNVEFEEAVASGGVDGVQVNLSFTIQGQTIEEKIENMDLLLKETGISFVRDYEEVVNSLKVAYEDAMAATNSVSWNDILISDVENYAEARRIENEKLTNFVNKFEEVKDNTVLSRYQQGKLDRNTKFPYVTKSSFDASYKDNVVTINSSNLTVEDLVLFESGQNYTIEYALAEYNEENEGYFDLLPIVKDTEVATPYNGSKTFSVSSSNIKFALPVPHEGTFELVSYIVNVEGIRVTRPQPVKVNSVESNNINIHNYSALVSKTNEGLLGVESKINENVVLVIKEPKEAYTYEELHQLLSSEAYTYGVVSNSKIEKLNESNSWVSLNGNETQLTSGSYRLAFTTQDGNQVFVSTIF